LKQALKKILKSTRNYHRTKTLEKALQTSLNQYRTVTRDTNIEDVNSYKLQINTELLQDTNERRALQTILISIHK